MESPKADKIPGSTGVDAQPEDNLEKNELKDEITTTAAVKLESEENSKVNGESLSVAIASELKKDIIVNDVVKSANPKPNENGLSEVKKEPEIVSNDREFVLTTKNLERVRDELRQEEVLHGKKSPLKSVNASSIKQELVNALLCLMLCVIFKGSLISNMYALGFLILLRLVENHRLRF